MCSMIYVPEWISPFGFICGRDKYVLSEGQKQSKITISPTRSFEQSDEIIAHNVSTHENEINKITICLQ